ncbi:MAG: hypothetical protein AAGB27_12145, partial [Pseudomonadota bacterium]
MQRVLWEDSDDPAVREEGARRAAAVPPETTMTAWFKLSRETQQRERDAQGADFLARGEVDSRTLLYTQLAKHFIWTPAKTWQPRKKGETQRRERLGLGDDDMSSDKVARVYAVSPTNREAFYCRALLAHVRGPTKHADLRVVPGK